MNGFSKTLNSLEFDTVDRSHTRTTAGSTTRGQPFQPKTRPKTHNKVAQPQPGGLKSWLRVQALNVTRHADALRSFQHDEFGKDPASPSDAHIDAVNQLMHSLRLQLAELSRQVEISADIAKRQMDTRHLQQLMQTKDLALAWVRAIETIWDFYFELFGQRQSQFENWLLGCDRIALDCYQDIYMAGQTHLIY